MTGAVEKSSASFHLLSIAMQLRFLIPGCLLQRKLGCPSEFPIGCLAGPLPLCSLPLREACPCRFIARRSRRRGRGDRPGRASDRTRRNLVLAKRNTVTKPNQTKPNLSFPGCPELLEPRLPEREPSKIDTSQLSQLKRSSKQRNCRWLRRVAGGYCGPGRGGGETPLFFNISVGISAENILSVDIVNRRFPRSDCLLWRLLSLL